MQKFIFDIEKKKQQNYLKCKYKKGKHTSS